MTMSRLGMRMFVLAVAMGVLVIFEPLFDHLRLMSTFFVTLMCNALMGVHIGNEWCTDRSARPMLANGTSYRVR